MRVHQEIRSKRRANPRYRLSPAPEVEVLQAENGASSQAKLCNISLGGCFLETNYELPLETEVTLILKKGVDQVTARARVVQTVKHKGLAMAFTSMSGEDFQILEDWLSLFVATKWAAGNRRRGQRVAMQIEVKVSGYNREGTQFTEDTRTVGISASGCFVNLQTPVNKGQRLVLCNTRTKRLMECMVASLEAIGAGWQVGLAFVEPNQLFWPIHFPPADWSRTDPEAKQYGS